MTTTLILPGLNGSGDGHWQRHWLADHADSRLLEQDDSHNPRVEAWLTRLEEALEREGEAFIVAHSLGCLLAAKLAGRPSARRVKGALLVGPCDLQATEKLHPGAIEFGVMPTRALPFPSITVGSLNDLYMPLDRLSFYTQLWKSPVRNLGLAGHINIASGFGRWTGGYVLLEAVKDRAAAEPRERMLMRQAG